MGKTVDDYVATLTGWQAETVKVLRRSILAAGGVTETVKWGPPTYEANGPVSLVKAHQGHVTLGFWRGTALTSIEPRLEAGSGGATMAYIKLKGADEISAATIARLVDTGIVLNREQGDPLKKTATP